MKNIAPVFSFLLLLLTSNSLMSQEHYVSFGKDVRNLSFANGSDAQLKTIVGAIKSEDGYLGLFMGIGDTISSISPKEFLIGNSTYFIGAEKIESDFLVFGWYEEGSNPVKSFFLRVDSLGTPRWANVRNMFVPNFDLKVTTLARSLNSENMVVGGYLSTVNSNLLEKNKVSFYSEIDTAVRNRIWAKRFNSNSHSNDSFDFDRINHVLPIPSLGWYFLSGSKNIIKISSSKDTVTTSGCLSLLVNDVGQVIWDKSYSVTNSKDISVHCVSVKSRFSTEDELIYQVINNTESHGIGISVISPFGGLVSNYDDFWVNNYEGFMSFDFHIQDSMIYVLGYSKDFTFSSNRPISEIYSNNKVPFIYQTDLSLGPGRFKVIKTPSKVLPDSMFESDLNYYHSFPNTIIDLPSGFSNRGLDVTGEVLSIVSSSTDISSSLDLYGVFSDSTLHSVCDWEQLPYGQISLGRFYDSTNQVRNLNLQLDIASFQVKEIAGQEGFCCSESLLLDTCMSSTWPNIDDNSGNGNVWLFDLNNSCNRLYEISLMDFLGPIAIKSRNFCGSLIDSITFTSNTLGTKYACICGSESGEKIFSFSSNGSLVYQNDTILITPSKMPVVCKTDPFGKIQWVNVIPEAIEVTDLECDFNRNQSYLSFIDTTYVGWLVSFSNLTGNELWRKRLIQLSPSPCNSDIKLDYLGSFVSVITGASLSIHNASNGQILDSVLGNYCNLRSFGPDIEFVKGDILASLKNKNKVMVYQIGSFGNISIKDSFTLVNGEISEISSTGRNFLTYGLLCNLSNGGIDTVTLFSFDTLGVVNSNLGFIYGSNILLKPQLSSNFKSDPFVGLSFSDSLIFSNSSFTPVIFKSSTSSILSRYRSSNSIFERYASFEDVVIKAYPNPTSGKLFFTGVALEDYPIRVDIYNLVGANVYSGILIDSRSQIDDFFYSGVGLVRLKKVNGGLVKVFKVLFTD